MCLDEISVKSVHRDSKAVYQKLFGFILQPIAGMQLLIYTPLILSLRVIRVSFLMILIRMGMIAVSKWVNLFEGGDFVFAIYVVVSIGS